MEAKNGKKTYLNAVVCFFIIYFLLLAALLYFEKGEAGSHINSFGDAIWFSLVTISTVGYGDITPMSAGGRIIGAVFLLLSMGALVALFGSVVSVLASEGLPMFRLRFRRKQNWYYFAEFTSESDALARDVLREDPSGVIIYGIGREKDIEKPDYPCFYINLSPARIVKHKKGVGRRCNLFFLEEDDIGRSLKALDIHELDAEVYARTMSGQENMSGNIHFFHSYDCCARSYWRENPLDSAEDNVVLIGFGNYGMALLERAILMNINDSDFDVTYHVFGDWKRFLQVHDGLGAAMGINERCPGHDSIYFHEEEWTAAHDVIASADRIVICEDNESEGWDDLWQIQRYYENKGRIYLRSNRVAPGVRYFGTNEQIYTVNQIVRSKLNYAAVLMNDLYRSSVKESLDWDELDDRLRQSKIAAADHLIMKVRVLLDDRTITDFDKEKFLAAAEAFEKAAADPEKLDMLRRIEHARWMRFYAYYNWRYGETESAKKREHPLMLEYDELTDRQKMHHDHAWELVSEIAGKIM